MSRPAALVDRRTARTPLAARFESKVDRSGGPDACHLWTAGTVKGYGSLLVWIDGQKRYRSAHRIAWELAHGPIPDGQRVCHDCDARYPVGDIANRRCVNPRHLFLGSARDNSRDALIKGRMSGGKRGRSGSLRPHLGEIRRRLASGESSASIAASLGSSRGAIDFIASGQSYAGVVA